MTYHNDNERTVGDVKERPILFCGEMVRAILDGRKTQTRRVMTFPVVKWGFTTDYRADSAVEWRRGANGWQAYSYCTAHHGVLAPECPPLVCKYGDPGDRLWVRETWADIPQTAPGSIHYRANATAGDFLWFHENNWKWRPSIFMPRWASRITLEITDVRVQRVQEISEVDAVAEGVQGTGLSTRVSADEIETARESYSRLWDSLNAKRGFGWDANPWVWAITFGRAE